MNLLNDWLRANEISLNTAKTEIVLFRTKNKTIKKHLNFRLSGQSLKLSKQVTYLGLIIDEHLEWKYHFDHLINKLSRGVGIIRKIRHYVDIKTCISIYYALFDSYVFYSIQAWGHVKYEYLNKIYKLQNNVLKLIYNKVNLFSMGPIHAYSRILPLEKKTKVPKLFVCLQSTKT